MYFLVRGFDRPFVCGRFTREFLLCGHCCFGAEIGYTLLYDLLYMYIAYLWICIYRLYIYICICAYIYIWNCNMLCYNLLNAWTFRYICGFALLWGEEWHHHRDARPPDSPAQRAAHELESCYLRGTQWTINRQSM